MTQRYVAPIQIVSVQPEYPRYSVQEDRRKPVDQSSPARRPDPRSSGVGGGPSHRDFRALGLLVLLAALALVIALSFLL